MTLRFAPTAPAAAVAGLALAMAPMLQAGTATAAPAVHPAPVPVTRVALHSDFTRALKVARHGPIEGMAAPFDRTGARPAHPRHGTRPASCTEPNCDLNWGGGPVQHTPHVYLLLWGPDWSSTGTDTEYLNSFYSGLGGSGDSWSPITSQYGDGTGNPGFANPVYMGAFQDTTVPIGTDNGAVSQSDLTAEADAFVQQQSLSDLGDVQVVIAAQSGTCFDDGWAGQPGSCAVQPGHAYCGWHTSSFNGETFTNLPYSPDAGAGCGENFVNQGSQGTYDGFSMIGGHEYAESITDPQPISGWIDTSDNVSGGEIGDKCVWGGGNWGGSDPFGDVSFSTGSFAMQSLWSNSAGGCVMGVAPTGEVRGFGGKCVDDTNDASTNGNKVQIWTCRDDTSQQWTVEANGTLRHGSVCIDDPNNVRANGVKIVTWACNSNKSQVWTRSGQTLQHDGFCLDDTGSSTKNGTQLQLWKCTGKANQAWSLP